MTDRKPHPPQRLITITVQLPKDEAAAFAKAVYVVTSWDRVNESQRAVRAVQAAAKQALEQEVGQ